MPGIRLLGAGEAAVLGRLHDECFDEPFNAAGFAALLASPGMWAALAWQNGSGQDDSGSGPAAGYVMARSVAGEAEIVSIGVRPDARRLGIGAALLADAMVRAIALGADAIFLEVAEDNPAAVALYRSAGFEGVGRRPDYYPRKSSSPVAALIMRHTVKKSVS
jgi:[ribosomal protein S18]-alanine N-acetyltransferase